MPVFGPDSTIEPAMRDTRIAVADCSALKGRTMWQFWVDRGGTFTDIVARRPDGQLVSHKLLSENPERYEDAAVQGIRDLLDLNPGEEIPGPEVEAVKMGTTVATNALLERKGDRTVLLITKGFVDLLRIGYQNRPKLFELHIRLPELLYERVEEMPERLNAAGEVLTPLCEQSVRNSLQAAYDVGIRSAAIAFMHAYKSSAHERRAAEIAVEVGFTQVSTSHEASSLMKLVGRGETTVVDAYLSPILRRYVARVRSALSGSTKAGRKRLLFMQSNGGLTDADRFQGKDAILSGPAGGVVGMARTGEIAGHRNLIGFDMGGTSTDVCHYAGKFERSFETEVAGVRIRAPMMRIHTVAAGGGSILSFREGRFQVGPESAGANPGPACYRRGGPLTVTDCNVRLGRIQPDHFPRVFGPGANEPLNPEAVREKFENLARNIAKETGRPEMATEEVAEGFLRVAVENMARAIKKISIERGHDVTRYTLNCFGGAGGQHACRVADALGMSTVLLHPLAGVLSAYGMGLAEIRALRQRQFNMPLSAGNCRAAKAEAAALAKEAVEEVEAQGTAAGKVRSVEQALLRYEGSHQIIEIALGDAGEMREAFDAAHRKLYGFADPGRRVLIDALSIEAIGAPPPVPEPEREIEQTRPRYADKVEMHADGKFRTTPLYLREELKPGQTLSGPAIVAEATGTVVVEPDWRANVDARGNLVLERSVPRAAAERVGESPDPVMLEVFNNLFMSIAEQMGATLANTAYSVNIKERLDFSCALFDPGGGLVANAPHIPVHLGSMGESVRAAIRNNKGRMRPGDVYVLNAPYNGGTHLPDITVVTPVFGDSGREILFFVGSRGHHADVGGRTPGSAPPDSTRIEEEGVLIDNFKMVDQGTFLENETRALLRSGPYPCRSVDNNIADLAAQAAANETGAREVRKMVEQFGLGVVQAYMRHVQDNAEESVRRVIGKLADGRNTYELDSGARIEVRFTVDRPAREAVIDFTGTSGQDPGNYNAPLAVCRSAVLYVFRTLVGSDIPLNEGCLKPLRLIVPTGTFLNPEYPAAVIAGNTEVSQAVADALYGALGVIAGSQGTMNNHIWGNESFQNYETIGGGAGAGPSFDGADAIHTHMTNTRMTDPEVLEWRFPVRLEEFSIRKSSGGKGRHRGGNGIRRVLRFLEPMTTTVLSSHRRIPPQGAAGGEPGLTGRNAVRKADGELLELGGNDIAEVGPDDLFIMETPGGGGFGAIPNESGDQCPGPRCPRESEDPATG